MIKAVIFDYYGVIQTDQVIVWCEKNSADHPDLRSKVDEASARIDLDEITLDQYFEELAAAVNRPVDVVRQELRDEVAINQSLLKAIDQLRERGLKTAILSNDGSSLRAYLDDHDITKHFDEVFISGEINMMKPDPRIYQYCAQQLKLHPSEILFFDDRQSNVDGAIRAGLQAEMYISISQVRQVLSDLL